MPERTFRNRELRLLAHRIAFASGQDVDQMLARISVEQFYERVCAYMVFVNEQRPHAPSMETL